MATASTLAVKRSPLRVIGFSILSAGLYGLYWFYVTRQEVTRELKTNDNAGLQTVGLLVPILNLFITYWLWRDIDKLHRAGGGEGMPVNVYLGIVIAAALLGWIPFIGWALGIAAIVVYVMILQKLNEAWDKKTNGKATEAPIGGGEIAVVVVGALLWVLILAAGVLGAIFADNSDDFQDELNKAIKDAQEQGY